MFGGARRDLTSTDEETGPEGPFSDDAGYAAPVRGGHERVQHFGRGSGSPRKAAVMSDSEDYTGSDVPMQAYDPKAPRPARVDESEGECYAHLHIAPTYPELTTTSRIMLEISQVRRATLADLADGPVCVLCHDRARVQWPRHLRARPLRFPQSQPVLQVPAPGQD